MGNSKKNVTDSNLAWKEWEINSNKVLDRHAPLRRQRIRQTSIPWLNSNIKKMMRDRDYHKKQYVKHNSEYHWRLYQIFRNKVNIEIRKSNSHYYCQKIGECNKNDPKNTWKLINSLTGHSSKSKPLSFTNISGGAARHEKVSPKTWRILTFADAINIRAICLHMRDSDHMQYKWQFSDEMLRFLMYLATMW